MEKQIKEVNWRVAKNPIDPAASEYIYTVYRLRDPEKPDHSGNREEAGVYDSKEKAENVVNWLNKKAAEEGLKEITNTLISLLNCWGRSAEEEEKR